MAKQKQFNNDFNVLYSMENNPWTGGVEHSSGGIFVQE